LYSYAKELETVLNELSDELYSGNISWNELQSSSSTMFAQEVSNISAFSSIDSTFDEYEGLIYDGAYSEHLNRNEKKALIGEEITEEQAKEKISLYVNQNVENITSNGLLENTDIQVYSFEVSIKDSDEKFYIEITKIGGYLFQMNNSKNVNEEKISQDDANEIGKQYLEKIGFSNMKETYYTKRENILTVNYAYEKDGVVYYSDLVKVKIALDNGEILGVETSGYLNCHYDRNLVSPKISIEEAKSNLNQKLELISEGKAVIPVETGEEIYCYEFKGKVEDKDFLVYINVETGKEENILIILDTEGGTLTI
jgi:germination protein YpeB